MKKLLSILVWVAVAGPATNLLLATLSALAIRAVSFFHPDVYAYLGFLNHKMMPAGANMILFPLVGMLYFSVILNVVLMTINLIPIPPADGGRIVTGLLPDEQAEKFASIEPYGLIILVVIILYNPLGIVNRIIWPIIEGIVNILL